MYTVSVIKNFNNGIFENVQRYLGVLAIEVV